MMEFKMFLVNERVHVVSSLGSFTQSYCEGVIKRKTIENGMYVVGFLNGVSDVVSVCFIRKITGSESLKDKTFAFVNKFNYSHAGNNSINVLYSCLWNKKTLKIGNISLDLNEATSQDIKDILKSYCFSDADFIHLENIFTKNIY